MRIHHPDTFDFILETASRGRDENAVTLSDIPKPTKLLLAVRGQHDIAFLAGARGLGDMPHRPAQRLRVNPHTDQA